ncbi:MAG TPA: PepSY domain-containing protein [Nitrobacter sp.]|nr:PepSY domain-containing protein [Nitrobacter sp.]
MRTRTLFLIAAVSLGAVTPALAYDTGSLLSMDEALGVATAIGLASVSDAEFAGNEWQIEGRDISGRYMDVDVDATTGEVLNVDR